MKLNYDQVASRKDKAARFVRDVLRDELRAEEIEDESVEDYGERRRIDIVESNPRRADMALTKKQLDERLEELEAENAELEEKLDSILDIAEPEDEDDDPDEDEDEDPEGEE